MNFTSKKIVRKKTDVTGKQPNYETIGILTIKGQPAEIGFPVSISGPIAKPMGGELVYTEGEKVINLKDFVDTFNHLPSDKMVYDDSIKLIFSIGAEKQN